MFDLIPLRSSASPTLPLGGFSPVIVPVYLPKPNVMVMGPVRVLVVKVLLVWKLLVWMGVVGVTLLRLALVVASLHRANAVNVSPGTGRLRLMSNDV